MPVIEGCILTPDGFVRGRLVHGRTVLAIEGAPVDEAEVRAGAGPVVLPGFVDLHVHGGGGHDVMAGGDAVAHVARAHARFGTTALLATTMTAPMAEIRSAITALAPHVGTTPAGGARVLGVHLEGPFISPDRLGAQPDFTAPGTLQDVQALHRLAPIRLVTLAPERPGHLELVRALHGAGFRVQLGHTAASYEDCVAALEAGACGFTHLYNAMSALHHRAPGAVGAALAHARRSEVIVDLQHVHRGALLAALRAIPDLYCVTDSTAAAGMPDGEYRLGRHVVHKCLGGVRLADGTLAGSALTMDQALRNLIQLGLSWREASRRCSEVPADHLGVPGLGRLVQDASADIVVLDAALQVRRVLVEGAPIG